MIIKHGRHICWEIHEMRKAEFLDYAFRMLIGWAANSNLWSEVLWQKCLERAAYWALIDKLNGVYT